MSEEAAKPELSVVLEHYGAEGLDPVKRQYQVRCFMGTHEDSRPSMSVDLDKGLVKCFACGFGGDAYSIIMTKENCDFQTALARATEREWGSGGSVQQPAGNAGGRVRVSLFDRREGSGGRDGRRLPARRRARAGTGRA